MPTRRPTRRPNKKAYKKASNPLFGVILLRCHLIYYFLYSLYINLLFILYIYICHIYIYISFIIFLISEAGGVKALAAPTGKSFRACVRTRAVCELDDFGFPSPLLLRVCVPARLPLPFAHFLRFRVAVPFCCYFLRFLCEYFVIRL